MNAAVLERDAFAPQQPPGIRSGLMLALLAHSLLILALVWGVNPVVCDDVMTVAAMTDLAVATASKLQFASRGQTIVIAAGMPFGTSGTTNLLRIAQID